MNCGNLMKMKKVSCGFICSREHMNPQLTCSQRQWRHSSVGRASHRFREVTGSSPEFFFFFFSGFFTQLHKLRSLRRSFLHFHFQYCNETCAFVHISTYNPFHQRPLDSRTRTTASTRFDFKFLRVFSKYRLPGKLHFTIFHLKSQHCQLQ